MDDKPSRDGVSLRSMMLALFVAMAIAAGIAYLLVYPFFRGGKLR